MTSQLISYLNTGSATNGFSKCKPAGAGEGYHAGYINFNTHYGTALQVISIFTGKGGDAARFNAFLPTLNANIATHKDSVAGLEGFCDAWRAVAKDSSSLFKDAQTYVVNGLYGSIAKARAEARSVQLSITKAALLDIAIVNGIRSGKDIFEDIVSGADAASFFVDSSVPGAKMKINGKDVDEISWLNELLKKWEKVNPAAQPHVKVFRELISTGHHSFDSKQPLTVDRGSGSVTIGCSAGGPPDNNPPSNVANPPAKPKPSPPPAEQATPPPPAKQATPPQPAAPECEALVTSQIISYLSTGSVIRNGSMCYAGGAGDGYYAGYINFSTKYGSVVQVIDEFMRSGGSGTQFGPLLDKLRAYAATGNGSVVGLDGFCGAWNTTAAANPGTFLKAQTTVVNRVYGAVATRHAEARGIRYGLTKAALLDIAIVNGVGGGDNAIDEIARGADAAYFHFVGSRPGVNTGVNGKEFDEIIWINALLKKWESVNPSAMPHIQVFRELISKGYYSFDSKQPVTVNGRSGSVTIGCSAGGSSGNNPPSNVANPLPTNTEPYPKPTKTEQPPKPAEQTTPPQPAAPECEANVTFQLISQLSTGSTQSISRCRPGGDGKGYFAGYINFSTKYNNVLPVINEFRSMGGDSGQFDTLLRALEDYGSSNSGEVAGLGDFCDAWKAAAAAQPDTFVKAQKSAVDKMYGAVATRLAQDRGIRLSITKAALLDIAIVNGVGDGMNSIGAIVKRTDAAVVPADNNISGSKIRVNGKEVDEITWLETLMTKWVEANPSAQWRVDLFQMLLDDRRYSFDMKEPYTVKGYAGSIIFDCSAGTT